VPSLRIITDLIVRSESDPVRNGPVLPRLLGEDLLGPESLLGWHLGSCVDRQKGQIYSEAFHFNWDGFYFAFRRLASLAAGTCSAALSRTELCGAGTRRARVLFHAVAKDIPAGFVPTYLVHNSFSSSNCSCKLST
jgi:hypothetical protein